MAWRTSSLVDVIQAPGCRAQVAIGGVAVAGLGPLVALHRRARRGQRVLAPLALLRRAVLLRCRLLRRGASSRLRRALRRCGRRLRALGRGPRAARWRRAPRCLARALHLPDVAVDGVEHLDLGARVLECRARLDRLLQLPQPPRSDRPRAACARRDRPRACRRNDRPPRAPRRAATSTCAARCAARRATPSARRSGSPGSRRAGWSASRPCHASVRRSR